VTFSIHEHAAVSVILFSDPDAARAHANALAIKYELAVDKVKTDG